MKMMKGWVMLMVLMLSVLVMGSSCQKDSTLGNGKVDPVEKATLNLAVGVTLSARPKMIAPVYAVSTAILALLPADATQEVPI